MQKWITYIKYHTNEILYKFTCKIHKYLGDYAAFLNFCLCSYYSFKEIYSVMSIGMKMKVISSIIYRIFKNCHKEPNILPSNNFLY